MSVKEKKFAKYICFFILLTLCLNTVNSKKEIDVTTPSTMETTTSKLGFFGGIRNLFRGSSSTPAVTISKELEITTPSNVRSNSPFGMSSTPKAQTLPSLVVSHALLMPLGPRPETPQSLTPMKQQQMPQWPLVYTSSTNTPIPIKSINDIKPQVSASFTTTTTTSIPPTPKHTNHDLTFGSGVNGQGREKFSNTQDRKTGAKTVEDRTSFDSSPLVATGVRPILTKEDFPPLPLPSVKPLHIQDSSSTLPTVKKTSGPTKTSFGPMQQPTGQNSVSFVPRTGLLGSSTTIRPSSSLATDDEITRLTESLYNKEISQLHLINVNVQGKTRSIDSSDEAPQPLLAVDEKALETTTIAKMRLLFNNYDMDTLVNEYVTPHEKKEENDFVDSIMGTAVMRHALQFLQNKGIVTADPKSHRDLIKELWFTQYSRGKGKIGSSGFEHVFVNEIKNGTIIGLHNWVYFYEEEQSGHLDYKGYLNQLNLGTKAKIVKTRFTLNSVNKPVNTLFIGTSPELEIALYTICFKIRPEKSCPISLGNAKFSIMTYSWRYRGKNLIGSAYPEI